MAGLVHLLEIGVRALEIDVQNTSDGTTVVWCLAADPEYTKCPVDRDGVFWTNSAWADVLYDVRKSARKGSG